MSNISLRHIGTKALIEWAERHFYYLPESINESQTWCDTMQHLVIQLHKAGYSVELSIKPSPDSNNPTLLDMEQISDNESMELAAKWRKHLHQLNEDDLEGCSLALLDKLLKLPQIPLSIGDKLGDAFDHYQATYRKK